MPVLVHAAVIRTPLESLLTFPIIIIVLLLALSTCLPAQPAHVRDKLSLAVPLVLPLRALSSQVHTVALSTRLPTVHGHVLPVLCALGGAPGGPFWTSGVVVF